MSRRPKFQTLAAIRSLPKATWLVKRLIPSYALGAIYGPSGAGKSFLLLDLCAHILLGIPWFGFSIPKPLRVALVVLEGQGGFAQRMDAWEKVNGRPFPDGLLICLGPFSLTDEASVNAAIEEINALGGADIVFIDTLNRAAPDSDENSSQDMGRIISLATKLRKGTQSSVFLIHHSGKDERRGLRGHSSLLAALDTSIEVKCDAEGHWWRLEKSKDAKAGSSHSFELREAELGVDEDGDSLTSVAIVDMGVAAATRAAKCRKPSPNQAIVLGQITKLIEERSTYLSHVPVVGISWKDLAAAAKDPGGLDVPMDRKVERTKEAAKALVAAGYLRESDGKLYLPA